MRTIRILIADDSSTDIQDLLKSLNAYFKAKKISADNYEIVSTDKIDSALQIISKSKPFDIFFADINFSEKNDEQRNGYLLVRKAFELCPITFICVYSGTADEDVNLQKEYVDLLKRGMLADIYKKDFFVGSSPTEFNNRFKRAWNFVKSKQFIWDIWNNHESILSKIEKIPLHFESRENENRKSEIIKNFEAILFLLRNIDLLSSRVIVYRLCLQLYHRCLEILITGDKDEETIVKESEANKQKVFEFVKDLIVNDEFRDKKSFLRKLAAFTVDRKYRFGHIVNWYRNGSVHTDKKFVPELSNVIYANLTLTLYLSDKKEDINFQLLQSSLNENLFEGRGKKDLQEIINYIQNTI